MSKFWLTYTATASTVMEVDADTVDEAQEIAEMHIGLPSVFSGNEFELSDWEFNSYEEDDESSECS